jgi:hypothetical protein
MISYREPNAEALGYFRMSLRDKEGGFVFQALSVLKS